MDRQELIRRIESKGIVLGAWACDGQDSQDVGEETAFLLEPFVGVRTRTSRSTTWSIQSVEQVLADEGFLADLVHEAINRD